jgi:hypothetical protein
MQISGPDGIEEEPRRMHFDKGKGKREEEKNIQKKEVTKKSKKT